MKFDLQPGKVHARFVWSSTAQRCICAKIFANIKIPYCTVLEYHRVLREAIGPDPAGSTDCVQFYAHEGHRDIFIAALECRRQHTVGVQKVISMSSFKLGGYWCDCHGAREFRDRLCAEIASWCESGYALRMFKRLSMTNALQTRPSLCRHDIFTPVACFNL